MLSVLQVITELLKNINTGDIFRIKSWQKQSLQQRIKETITMFSVLAENYWEIRLDHWSIASLISFWLIMSKPLLKTFCRWSVSMQKGNKAQTSKAIYYFIHCTAHLENATFVVAVIMIIYNEIRRKLIWWLQQEIKLYVLICTGQYILYQRNYTLHIRNSLSLFHSRLKTYLFHKSYPRNFTSSSRTALTDYS